MRHQTGPPWDRLALPGLLVVAAVLRLQDLATRGTWDADQGHDMLVLRTFVTDGVVPLLGPPTSIGDVHHGAWYYYLLSPAAALTGGDSPLAVVTLIALCGVAAVGVVWWLARSIAGPVAGLVAGLVLAVSAAAVDESTFIWNPNLIALSSAIALAAAWRASSSHEAWSSHDARSGHDARWWVVAAVGTAVTMQCHVLGIALLPIVGVPFILDARRRSMGRVPLAILLVFVAAYLPLVVNELTRDFSELRAALEFLASGGSPADVAIPVRFGIVALRVVSWPLTGLIIDGFAAGGVALVVVIAIVVWRWIGGREELDQRVARWFGLGLLWAAVFLTLAAPSLASVVRGLPNDHYHAYADPMVVVLVGLGAAALLREIRAPMGVIVAGVGVATLLGWNLTHLPPAVNPDGGYPAAARAADRVDAALTKAGIGRDAAIHVRSVPQFKSTEALAYPLVLVGRRVLAETPDGLAPGSQAASGAPPPAPEALVVLCDQLFREAIGADCGGPAEAKVPAEAGEAAFTTVLDRFEAAPGRWVTIFAKPG
jgi:4-amino-4-deoxy-L-arabinose transferase-like glycosyltransferase